MKYTIISINDDRIEYKNNIRNNVPFEEVLLPAVDATDIERHLGHEIQKRKLHSLWGNAKRGETGVWLSNFDRWAYVVDMDEPLIVFEDDAVVQDHFAEAFSQFTAELPEQYDFAALWVPDNQKIDYQYSVEYNEIGDPIIHGTLPYDKSLFKHSLRCARVYQGYGMVALMYTPQGGRKLVELAKQYGMYTPVDCFIYQQAHMGNLDGYAPTPFFAHVVGYDWQAQSHVQQTERVK